MIALSPGDVVFFAQRSECLGIVIRRCREFEDWSEEGETCWWVYWVHHQGVFGNKPLRWSRGQSLRRIV